MQQNHQPNADDGVFAEFWVRAVIHQCFSSRKSRGATY
jgi:hypothetical protein